MPQIDRIQLPPPLRRKIGNGALISLRNFFPWGGDGCTQAIPQSFLHSCYLSLCEKIKKWPEVLPARRCFKSLRQHRIVSLKETLLNIASRQRFIIISHLHNKFAKAGLRKQ